MTGELEVASQQEITPNTPGELSTEQLKFIAGTDFIPKAIRGNLPAILACVATGRSLGLSDMHALRSINIIDGKASMSAELMVALVRQQGHSIQGNFGDGEVTVTGRRRDNEDEITVTWTREMAERAGLLGKQNWTRYPESMLWARAVSQLCRMLYSDCLGGVVYTPDEAETGEEFKYEGMTPGQAELHASIGESRPPDDEGPDDSEFVPTERGAEA